MTGGRVLPLLVGLWACSAFGQTVLVASETIPIDAGSGYSTRAFVVTSGTAEYAMVNAGLAIQVFDTSGNQLPALNGTFSSFAAANNIPVSTSATTTLVAAADIGGACSGGMCLRIYFWDASNGFQEQPGSPYVTSVLTTTAMTIDTSGTPFQVYYATPTLSLYEQAVTVSPTTGAIVVGVPQSRSLPRSPDGGVPGAAVGLTPDDPAQVLFLSDSASTLYTLPLDVTNLDGGVFALPNPPTTFGVVQGLTFFTDAAASSSFLFAGGAFFGLYQLLPNAGATVFEDFSILKADGGPTFPSGTSLNSAGNWFVVTEDDTGSGAWLNLVDAGVVDAGTSDGGTDGGAPPADAGSIPVIPIAPPGPGALPGPTNSCNCSSAGSAPVLLMLLLPLLLPRRRS